MTGRLKQTVALLVVCIAFGCATHEPVMHRLDTLEAIHRTERSESKAEFDALMREINIILMRLDAMAKNQANLLDAVAGQRELFQNAIETMRHTRTPVRDTSAPGMFPPVSPGRDQTAPDSDYSRESVQPGFGEQKPEAVYQTAYNDYLNRNYDLAILSFRNFLTAFPQSELASNAQYWIAECFYAQKNYERALEEFGIVLSAYPQSNKYLPALLKKGLSHINVGNIARGRSDLELLIDNYPYSAEARIAQDRLQNL